MKGFKIESIAIVNRDAAIPEGPPGRLVPGDPAPRVLFKCADIKARIVRLLTHAVTDADIGISQRRRRREGECDDNATECAGHDAGTLMSHLPTDRVGSVVVQRGLTMLRHRFYQIQYRSRALRIVSKRAASGNLPQILPHCYLDSKICLHGKIRKQCKFEKTSSFRGHQRRKQSKTNTRKQRDVLRRRSVVAANELSGEETECATN